MNKPEDVLTSEELLQLKNLEILGHYLVAEVDYDLTSILKVLEVALSDLNYGVEVEIEIETNE